MERSRAYYAAQGYERPYRWASFESVPFARLAKPLSQATLTLITTAMPIDDSRQGPKKVCSGSMQNPPEHLFNSDLAWDKQATHTEDLDSFFPVHHLQALVEEGRIGKLSSQFHCAPTDYSQRRTLEVDAPEILRRCREDQVDVALLVPL
jgi:hypothetical protein|tara:strand:- start:1640 stop:2089 length:450 start_codon:yes stop_codon:yes gene_type:complete